MKKISIIIPTYNEEETITEIVRRVTKQEEAGEVIIVDDGSTDKTWELLQQIKSPKPEMKLIKHKINQGKGAAIRSGLKRVSLDYVLIQDADLEYDPRNYPKLLKQASVKTVVYGSRLKTANDYAYLTTLIGNVLVTFLCNLLFKTKLSDSYTGYKLIPFKIFKSLKLKSKGFEIEAEITGKLAKRKIPIIEVPISYSPRKYKQGKKIKARDALKGAITYIKIKLDKKG